MIIVYVQCQQHLEDPRIIHYDMRKPIFNDLFSTTTQQRTMILNRKYNIFLKVFDKRKYIKNLWTFCPNIQKLFIMFIMSSYYIE